MESTPSSPFSNVKFYGVKDPEIPRIFTQFFPRAADANTTFVTCGAFLRKSICLLGALAAHTKSKWTVYVVELPSETATERTENGLAIIMHCLVGNAVFRVDITYSYANLTQYNNTLKLFARYFQPDRIFAHEVLYGSAEILIKSGGFFYSKNYFTSPKNPQKYRTICKFAIVPRRLGIGEWCRLQWHRLFKSGEFVTARQISEVDRRETAMTMRNIGTTV